jgi:hypothetical protein
MAVSSITNPKLCKYIQAALSDSFDPLIMESQKPITGLTDALRSAVNTQGVQQITGYADGATPKPATAVANGKVITLRGFNADCTVCDPAEDTFDRCNWTSAVSAKTPTSYAYTVGLSSCAPSMTFSLSDIWGLCEGQDTIVTENIRQLANTVKRDVNFKLTEAAIALMNDYYDGTDSAAAPITLNLLGTNGTTINYNEFAKIGMDYRKKGYTASPIVVGGDTVYKINGMQRALGLNSNGINLAAMPMPNMFEDFEVDTVYDDGDAHIITWVPKTFQLLEWFENRQTNSNFKGALIEVDGRTMYEEEWSVINVDGMEFDLYMKYDKCGGYKVALHKYFDIANLPTTAVCKYPAVQYLVACGTGSC